MKTLDNTIYIITDKMSKILVDFDNIIKYYKLDLLIKYTGDFPDHKFKTGIVLTIPDYNISFLESLPKGITRIKYINSVEFINSIIDYTFFIYNKKLDICEVYNSFDKQIINFISTNFPTSKIWTCIDLSLYDTSKFDGFINFYINDKSPSGFSLDKYMLCMTKSTNAMYRGAEIGYIINQFNTKNSYCYAKLKLSTSCINYLQQAPHIGYKSNMDGTLSQKEIGGKLLVELITDEHLHVLNIDHDSVIHGNDEGINIINGIYNFHSHPLNAYKKHGVKLAYPSAQDYIGFLISSVYHGALLHIVASVEGLYIISMNQILDGKKDINNIVKFIKDKYNFCYKEGMTVELYIEKINHTVYQDFVIFKVQFLDWKNADEQISINFSKTGMNCFSSDASLKNYKHLNYKNGL